MLPMTAGDIEIDGKPAQIRSVQDAIAHGIGYVPEDRLTEGLFSEQSIGRNVVVRTIETLRGRLGLTDPLQVQRQIRELGDFFADQDCQPGSAGQNPFRAATSSGWWWPNGWPADPI
jgi:ABC-type sugar transport system ATPase subunit